MPTISEESNEEIMRIAESLDTISKAIKKQADKLRDDPTRLEPALNILHKATLTPKGKIIITGVGKSYLISQKLAATMTSIGTRAISLHATEAVHGDLGIIDKGDCLLALSYSGETQEVIRVCEIIREWGDCWVVGMGKSIESPLGAMCDAWIECLVDEELSSNVCAPTTSSSLMLAMGDAIAVLLMQKRRFGPLDFARNHPGGFLGKQFQKSL
ncbi:hypothetical protein IWW36_000546 [Coemansia brasiliensis]|uniref:SIS domain-containing protein n=1 Tax=Coemansia brasiliensis TaxID=2650707 RepID=A0A9W8IIL4_9FUNG|nr:hypothetical protein IWW36_000546 [Coemansia brasiliensis]